jgi:hypothetical protein
MSGARFSAAGHPTSHRSMYRAATAGGVSGALPVPLPDPGSGPQVRRRRDGFPAGGWHRTETDQCASALANGIAERWIGSCRREILDQIIPLNEGRLRRILREYVNHHEQDRLHYSLAKDAPKARGVERRSGSEATVIVMPRIGGLAGLPSRPLLSPAEFRPATAR